MAARTHRYSYSTCSTMQHRVWHTVENMYHRSRNCNPQRVVHCIVAPTRFCAWVRKHSTESVARTYNEASFGGCSRKKGSPFCQTVEFYLVSQINMSMAKSCRVALTLKEKVDIIEQHGAGKFVPDIAWERQRPKTTVYTLLKWKEQILSTR